MWAGKVIAYQCVAEASLSASKPTEDIRLRDCAFFKNRDWMLQLHARAWPSAESQILSTQIEDIELETPPSNTVAVKHLSSHDRDRLRSALEAKLQCGSSDIGR